MSNRTKIPRWTGPMDRVFAIFYSFDDAVTCKASFNNFLDTNGGVSVNDLIGIANSIQKRSSYMVIVGDTYFRVHDKDTLGWDENSPGLGIQIYTGDVSENDGPKHLGYYLVVPEMHTITKTGNSFDIVVPEIKPESIKIDASLCKTGIISHDYECADDLVSHPGHYQSVSGLEVIDVVEAFTEGLSGAEATNTGNILKYVCRWKKKNGIQDLRKAMWYLQRLINHLEKEEKEGKSK